MTENCFYSLPKYILVNIAFEWLPLNCMCKTDTAITSTKFRTTFLNKINGARIIQHTINIGCRGINLFLKWCSLRSLHCKSLKVEVQRKQEKIISTSIFNNFLLYITNSFSQNDTLKNVTNVSSSDRNYSLLSLVSFDCSHGSLLDEISLSIIKHTPKLQTINLRKCYLVQNKIVILMAESCMQLTDVNLSCCYSVTEEGVSALLNNCADLTALNVFDCNLNMDKLFSTIGSALRPQLRSLDMGCFRLGRESSISKFCSHAILAASMPNLQYLNVSGRFVINRNVVQPVLGDLRHLLSLDIRGWTIKSEEAKDLIRHTQLETFIFADNHLASYHIETVVPRFANLTHLQYSGRKFDKIEHLQAIVENCVKLRVFDVTFNSQSMFFHSQTWPIDSEILTMATHCHTTLTEFHLHNHYKPQVSFETLQSVIQMCGSNLHVLDVTHVNALVDRSNAMLFTESMPHLKSIVLKDMTCTNATVIELAVWCRNLTVMDLSRGLVSDKAMIVAAKLCESLRSLTLHNNTRLSDAGIISLCKHRGSSLTSLSLLGNMTLTATAMESIAEHCVNLEKLDLSISFKSQNMVKFSNIVILVRNCGDKLRRLTIKNQNDCTDYCVKHIAQHCNQLTHLTIVNNGGGHSNYSTNYFLSTPLNCPLLRYLSLSINNRHVQMNGGDRFGERFEETRGKLFVLDLKPFYM